MRDADRPFLTAIAADPAADLPRLLLADHLDETGRPEWAELIRVQCEAARLVHQHRSGAESCRRCKLNRWANRLVPKLRDDRGIYSGLGLPSVWHPWRAVRTLASPARHDPLYLPDSQAHQFTIERGMPSAVACPLATWMGHGPAVVARLPVRRVEPTDRLPDWRRLVGQPGGMHFWHRLPVLCPPDSADLPAEIFDRLDPDVTDRAGDDEFRGHYGYFAHSVSDAVWADLSRALIEWAKGEARRLGLLPSLQAG